MAASTLESISRGLFGRTSGPEGMSFLALRHFLSSAGALKVGRTQIDAQHDAIFDIALEMADRWRERGNLQDMRGLCENLDRLLTTHFRHEERQLEEADASSYPDHRAEHHLMQEELRLIRARLDQSNAHSSAAAVPASQVRNFVLGLTIGHICRSDIDCRGAPRKPSAIRDRG